MRIVKLSIAYLCILFAGLHVFSILVDLLTGVEFWAGMNRFNTFGRALGIGVPLLIALPLFRSAARHNRQQALVD